MTAVAGVDGVSPAAGAGACGPATRGGDAEASPATGFCFAGGGTGTVACHSISTTALRATAKRSRF
jgi:hypothetical protein